VTEGEIRERGRDVLSTQTRTRSQGRYQGRGHTNVKVSGRMRVLKPEQRDFLEFKRLQDMYGDESVQTMRQAIGVKGTVANPMGLCLPREQKVGGKTNDFWRWVGSKIARRQDLRRLVNRVIHEYGSEGGEGGGNEELRASSSIPVGA